jgi:thiopurine S-methyltransferase
MGRSLRGVLEHSCLCALDPHQRPADLEAVARLLAPGGWLLALFWCHSRPGGPPRGSDPAELARQRGATGLQQELWEPARGSAAGRDGEWLGCGRVGGEVKSSAKAKTQTASRARTTPQTPWPLPAA